MAVFGRGRVILAIALLSASCSPAPPPPPDLLFQGLPVSGSLSFVHRAGFTQCIDTDAIHIRCRRPNVKLFDLAPFQAAVDLRGREGKSGFDQITLWNDEDQHAIYQLVVPLTRAGWRYCYTGTEQAGDQAIFTKPGEAVRMSIDISYYGKRRLRILPARNIRDSDKPCVPDVSVIRFGADIAEAVARSTAPSIQSNQRVKFP